MEKDITIHRDEAVLKRCRQMVEEQAGLGRSDSWSTQDFELLGDRISEKTGISLSVTTLKRVWGRIKYDSSPTATTLSALAQYLGYHSWGHFKEATGPQTVLSEKPASFTLQDIHISETNISDTNIIGNQPITDSEKAKFSHRSRQLGFVGLAGLILIVTIFLIGNAPEKLSSEDFSFSSEPVTTGIPNSVVFRYDASASPTDSVFIQQSWDPRRRQLVSRNGKVHSSIYYHPGYYLAKLVIGKEIVKEHDLLIPSEGWHVAVEQGPVPVYFKADQTIQNGEMHIPTGMLHEKNIRLSPEPPQVRYRYVKDWKTVRSNNFLFETRLRNATSDGAAACQRLRVLILCKNDLISIPLCAKGCVGDLALYLAGAQADARQTDLSAFGADLSKWVDLRCEVRDSKAIIFVNGKEALKTTLPNKATDIVGVSYEFEGSGAVDFVSIKKADGTPIFRDDFDSAQ